MARRRLAAAVVVSVAALAAGCGGDDESATEEWAGDVCTAITDWSESVASAAEAMQEEGSAEERLDEAMTTVADATRTLGEDLRDLGAPETESGDEAKALLDGLAGDLQDDVRTIEDAAESAEGVSETLSAISTISATLVAMGEAVAEAFGQLDQLDGAGELADAFESADACDEVTAGSS